MRAIFVDVAYVATFGPLRQTSVRKEVFSLEVALVYRG
jgi:hypothetical protein